MPLLAQALALFVAARLQASVPPSEVHGGDPVPAEEFEEVVALGGVCTGVVVGPRLVLTAAHCGVDWSTIDIDGMAVPVQRCASMHSPADASAAGQGQDFAACLLDQPVSNPPARLLTAEIDDPIAVGQQVRLIGYGEDESGAAGVKRTAVSQVFEVDDHYFAAGGGGVDTCRGDSGSPAFVEVGSTRYIAGVLSYGYACGDGGWYGRAEIADAWLRDEFGDDALPVIEDTQSCRLATPVRSPRLAVAFVALVLAIASPRPRHRNRARWLDTRTRSG